jgi:saccharopine dehydrogenase (NAD+, L-lysine-forming)
MRYITFELSEYRSKECIYLPEELESLVKNFPTLKRARFWMTFGQEYLTHLRVIQNIGMARIDEVDYNGVKIVPIPVFKSCITKSG